MTWGQGRTEQTGDLVCPGTRMNAAGTIGPSPRSFSLLSAGDPFLTLALSRKLLRLAIIEMKGRW